MRTSVSVDDAVAFTVEDKYSNPLLQQLFNIIFQCVESASLHLYILKLSLKLDNFLVAIQENKCLLFYRVMHMHSTDHTVARCLSVYPSHAGFCRNG